MVRGFLKLGIFVAQDASASEDANVATIIAAGLSSAFYPHGVGHLLGLDVSRMIWTRLTAATETAICTGP